MKKEEFIKLGLDEESAKKCEAASAEELKTYVLKAQFDDIEREKKKLELDVRDRDGQLETLKNSTGDVEGLKKQIETLQTENKTKDQTHAAEIKQLKVDAAIDAALTAAKARNSRAVKALLELDAEKIELAEDGSIKGLTEQLEAVKKSDAYLFDTETKKTQIKGAKPGESGVEGPDGKIDTSKMSYEELAAFIEQNPDTEI